MEENAEIKKKKKIKTFYLSGVTGCFTGSCRISAIRGKGERKYRQ